MGKMRKKENRNLMISSSPNIQIILLICFHLYLSLFEG
jgi:hypothetical protein